VDFLFSPARNAEAAQRFFVKTLGSSVWAVSPADLAEEKRAQTPLLANDNASRRDLRVINVDKNAAYPKAITELKASGMLSASVELRQVKYLNNRIEQDHRFIKRLAKPGMGFFSFETAWRTLQGYEAMNMIRKGQVQGVSKGDT
jgi:transposase-like protein